MATSLLALTNSLISWRYDPAASKKNGCRIYRLDCAGQTALAGRDNHPEYGPGWAIQIIGQPVYHYSDPSGLNLAEITADVGADMEALAPVGVIEKPADDNWCICPKCSGPATEVGHLKGTDCPQCGHVTGEDAIKLARRRRLCTERLAEEEAKNS